jgi:hypothetical protein
MTRMHCSALKIGSAGASPSHQRRTVRVSDDVVHGIYNDLVKASMCDDGPLAAIDLATANEIGGPRESKRRIVRAAIERLRNEPIGARVIATNGGYYLARDEREWQDYLAARAAGARFEFVRERKMAAAAYEAAGHQGKLF